MSIKLESVVPFGRSFDEYQQMFNLSEADLSKNILGVGDGPASFNTEMLKRGYAVTSLDPLYELSGKEIEQRFYQVVDDVIQQVEFVDTMVPDSSQPTKARASVPDVLLTPTSGSSGIQYAVNEYMRLKHLQSVASDHPVVRAMARWVEDQFSRGRLVPVTGPEIGALPTFVLFRSADSAFNSFRISRIRRVPLRSPAAALSAPD